MNQKLTFVHLCDYIMPLTDVWLSGKASIGLNPLKSGERHEQRVDRPEIWGGLLC